jgi:hypothetical protein
MKTLITTMTLTLILLPATLMADYSSYAVDNKESHEKTKVKMISGKKDSNRFYQGNLSKVYNKPINKVLSGILNFAEKCNQELADRRELTDKKTKCLYPNSNLVESKSYKITKKYLKKENETDRYLMARRIYNRQSFSHIDLITVYESKNSSGNRVVNITQEMLSDKEAKKYIDKLPVEQDSAFQEAKSNYTITQIDKNTTALNYYYASETDHWLLNKSVSVGQVFDSMGASIGLLFTSIGKASEL